MVEHYVNISYGKYLTIKKSLQQFLRGIRMILEEPA